MREALSQEIAALKEQGRLRHLKTVDSSQGREIMIAGRMLLNFCSNDYLGLAADQRLITAATQAMQDRGFGSGASRLVCGNMSEHRQLEEDLARMKRAEAAIVFSSGYMANVGVISALVGREDVVLSDRLNHASIVDGALLSRAELKRYAHKDMAALEKLLKTFGGSRRRLIVTDSVFSMDGDRAPLGDIVHLAKKYGAWVMVDEAHAFGVLGATGSGLVEESGLSDQVDIQMGTLSKAAGAFGSYVAGSKELVTYLQNRARSFIFTTAMPPAIAAAGCAALLAISKEPERRERVMVLAERLRSGLRGMGYDTLESSTPIVPVVVGDESRAVLFSNTLFEKGLFIQAIRPPTVPQGTSRLRVTVTASHRDEDIERCLAVFSELKAGSS